LQFNTTGDAVLVLYGNGTEYVKNLGSFSSLIGTDLDLTTAGPAGGNVLTSLTPLGAAGSNMVQYTIIGRSSTQFIFGNADPLINPADSSAIWTSGNKSSLGTNSPNYLSALNGWSQNLSIAGDVRSLIPHDDGLSFGSNLDPSSSGSLGMLPAGKQGFSTVDNLLYLLTRNVGSGTTNNNSLALVATASIVNGHFVVSAVPVPAAVVLFATGVIGLVGIARRRVLGL
jgi:hypothetical protein